MQPTNEKCPLYIAWALEHFVMIQRAIQYLGSTSNCNMMELSQSLIDARDKLIEKNSAYAEAWKIFQTMMGLGMQLKPLRQWKKEFLTIDEDERIA